MQRTERVAIVGIGGIFARSADLGRFWENIAGGVDASGEPPEGRWLLATADAYDPKVGAPDRVYATSGCFVEDFRLDPEGLDLDPALIERLDPMFHLALHAGRQAWRDATTDGLDHRRVGVIFGNIVLPTETTSALAREYLGRTFEEAIGLAAGPPGAVEPLNAFAAGLPAGVVAKALGLSGGSYTLDAACATSLYALKLAADELLEGRADAMLTGGLSRPDPLYTQMGFAQLRALSAKGKASPFDEAADGLIVGEGAGMFVLKRLSDALRDGDRIYATLAAVGLSNDVDGGLLAPSSEGQLRAMRAAYDAAGWDPRDIDLIECHATGTPVGDAVELESLRALWGEGGWHPGQCAIGSVKANVGHCLTAAGAAGLLRVLLALAHETLPPTANFRRAAPALGLESTPFRVPKGPERWDRREPGRPRRAAISGFGFGGINAHALLEEWAPDLPARGIAPAPAAPAEPPPIAIVGMGAHFGPFRGLRAFQERVLGGGQPAAPVELRDWWGIDEAAWAHFEGLGKLPVRGYRLDGLALEPGRFRIPPRELEEMLPQQSLALRVAAEAIGDAGWDERPRLRTGVFVGLGLDLNTTNFHLRWSLLEKAREWERRLGLDLSEAERARWTAELRDAAGPPLSANRTMGALGGLVASRIAREFRIGGPSFTIASEETSGTRALDVAVRMLGRGELDEALVGAVDLATDPRAVLTSRQVRPVSARGEARPFDAEGDGTVPADGAAALVLKRLDDALRDGDRVYAVIRGVGATSGHAEGLTGFDPSAYRSALARGCAEAGVAPASLGYLETHGSGWAGEDAPEAQALADLARGWPEGAACALGSSKAELGFAGAASGLAGVVKAALCLHREILPPLGRTAAPRPELADSAGRLVLPRGPQYWLRNRAEGPRRAGVAARSVDGNYLHVILEARESFETTVEQLQPIGARPFALFALEADDPAGLARAIDELETLAAASPDVAIETLARRWWAERGQDPGKPLGAAVVAGGLDHLRDQLAELRDKVAAGGSAGPTRPDERAHFSAEPLGATAEVAFVFPGLGNLFPGMGRDLSAHWPEVLRAQDAALGFLGRHLGSGTYWNADPPETYDDHCDPVLGQVAVGAMVADLLQFLGVRPAAVLGYSLGESAGLIALRAWPERDEALRRVLTSPLFRTELAGPCEVARRVWGIAPDEPCEWVAILLSCPAVKVREALAGRSRVYILIVNTPDELVIGGERDAVWRLVDDLGCRFYALPMVSTVHCELVAAVEEQYRALHRQTTTPPPGVRFYSAASGRAYVPDMSSAADAIVAHAVHGFDFTKVVEQAYADGVRVFLEAGPGGSCTRMIGRILGGRPHLAGSACTAGEDGVGLVLNLLARMVAERVPVDLGRLYGGETRVVAHRDRQGPGGPRLDVRPGGRPFRVPRPAASTKLAASRPAAAASTPAPAPKPAVSAPPLRNVPKEPRPVPSLRAPAAVAMATLADPIRDQFVATEVSKAEAHEAFLRVSGGLSETMANQMAFQMALLEALMAEPSAPMPPALETACPPGPPPALDRGQCLEFAVGSIGAVLGPGFAEVDAHPTRVRLPDEPLMLVDRILEIEGEPRSLSHGRVVTEKDVRGDDWYLDGGRMPACIAVESGQADLFLSGYLGIDFVTKGLAVYRLLDAVVTFHRGLPVPGEVIRYDIRIAGFFRQGDTHLFRFQFEATVDGMPLLTMSDGCAGFFTAGELAAGKGIVQTQLDRVPVAGVRPDDWEELVPMAVESYDDDRVEALRRGDLAGAFGAAFEGLGLGEPSRLPGGRMHLVDRVLSIDPSGGRYGLGLIRAEADIRPDAWFLTCHFVDDRVMPGTLMFECCLHTLRIFLARMGWVGEHAEVGYEPVPGVASRLKCRGQVVETTRKVTYEVSIKELGYRPEPYAIVDALMYADGKPIVEISNMSLRLTGLDRDALRRTWSGRTAPVAVATTPALYDRDRILAFCIGRPSEAFGAPYRVFDEERVIARLPGPPFLFMDRVTRVVGEPWKVAAGPEAEVEYDVPPDAWYFDAERQPRMPFAVLLEAALQPCGWLAAYMGSALTSGEDLKFRNLGGSAEVLEEVTPGSGTLTALARVTRVANSAGMIIQHFDFEVARAGRPVYRGDTYFGFFRRQALAEQVGIRDAAPYRPSAAELGRARSLPYPSGAPFPDDRLRMIERIDAYLPDGGPNGMGSIVGSTAVDPAAWFFKAHFYQDPVVPGSLGLESFLQLLKFAAFDRWGPGRGWTFSSPCLETRHRWTYRGQVIPGDARVTTSAVITAVDDARRRLRADGHLEVDGRVIYQMNDFTLAWGAES